MNVAITQNAYNTNFWVEFLELYKSFPTLWNKKSEIYRNRTLKAEAYNKMVEKLQEIDPTANREMVVKKINTFRTTYRTEAREVKYINTKLSGSGKTYKSSWLYFDLLSFIGYFIENPYEGTISSDEYKSLTSENKNSSKLPKKKKILKKVLKQTDDETLVKKGCDHLNEITDKTNKIDYNQKKKILKKAKKQTDDETLVKKGCDHLNEINNKTNKIDYENQKDNDEATILAKGWATQYAQLSNKQKLLSRKIFSDVLFHGSLNHLTENTVQELNNILDNPNWKNNYSMEPETKIELEDYKMESEVKIEMEDYIE